jgi:uncharacterized SAM-binding protein YcdF (DUF218 family)
MTLGRAKDYGYPPVCEAANMTEEILQAARLIWDFHQLRHTPIPADVIVALGTNDLRVAEFAADLYHRGYGKSLLCTGAIAHQGDLLATPWPRTEAEMYAEVAERHGVPRDRILLETHATNTAENIRLSRELLDLHGMRPKNVVLAVKPFMQRRTWATMAVVWPEMPASLVSPSMTLDEYFTEDLTPDKIINIMLGDLQRIWVYGRRGWSAPQHFPEQVLEAFAYLKNAGFDKHLIPED